MNTINATMKVAITVALVVSIVWALVAGIPAVAQQNSSVNTPLPERSTKAVAAAMDAMRPGPSGGWYTSGTSQAPLASPMSMLHGSAGSWGLMLQGVSLAVWTNQTGPRGRDKIFAPNWIMPMAARRMGSGGRGLITLRSMFSLEAATITSKRYPLLFQTGELAYGIPIINGQHPHDFVMELGVSYQHSISERLTLNFFTGPRGEPTLGPVAFPHRPSASENPAATISHHYQDSTHISSTVVSAGVTYGPITLEASGFHGREPDEHRWGIEQGALDSFAARATLTPTSRWAMQFSAGRINHREALHPNRDSLRTSASLAYSRTFAGGHWASTLIWGRNHDLPFTQLPQTIVGFSSLAAKSSPPRSDHIVSVPTPVPGYIYNSYLAESTLRFNRKHWIWGRVENTDRDSYLLYEEAPFVLFTDEQRYTRVQAYTMGYERELPSPLAWISTGFGGQLTLYGVPDNLSPIYGEHPVGMQTFLRIRLGSSEP